MITSTGGGLSWGPTADHGSPGWRHWSGGLVVHCDADGCAAVVPVSGLEHNGAAVECVYLRPEDRGWALGERDMCPMHAPPPADDEEGT